MIYPDVWHYKDANIELIRWTFNQSDRQRVFLNFRVDEKVDTFNSTILNVLSKKFFPHEVIICDDRDPP